MKKLTIALFTLGLAVASANTENPISNIKSHAERVRIENEQLSAMLKQKQPDLKAIQEKLTVTRENLDKIGSLVSEFESSNPKLSERDRADWELIKTKVQLLNIFHGRKAELATEDGLRKNRGLLRAHAQGVAKRAAMLQQTAGRLEQVQPQAE